VVRYQEYPVTYLMVVLANVLILPYFAWLLTLTTAAYLAHYRRRTREVGGFKSRFLIVIPAHNEEDGISGTVKSCLNVNYPRHLFETLVLADNCGDRTAEIARQCGATVLERHDLHRKSKGFALEDLFDNVRRSGGFEEFDAIVVVDADTNVDPRLLASFAKRVESGADWIQAYDTVSNRDASWRTRLMTYAFCLINGTKLLGQQALGLSAGLRGNGMCLTTRGLRRVPWSSSGLAEDEEFSWKLRIAGEKIQFEPDAIVYAAMLKEGGDMAASQRRRWEFGHDEARRKTLNRLHLAKRHHWLEKLLMLIELTMPKTTQLILCCVGICGLNIVTLYGSPGLGQAARSVLIGSSALMLTSVMLYALSPFFLFGLPWRFGLTLVYFPAYALWKSTVMLKGRPTQWVRAHRPNAHSQTSVKKKVTDITDGVHPGGEHRGPRRLEVL